MNTESIIEEKPIENLNNEDNTGVCKVSEEYEKEFQEKQEKIEKPKAKRGRAKIDRTPEETKEIQRNKTKQLYEKNKGIKKVCDICLGSYTYSNITHHKQSDKHKRWVEKLKKDKEENEKIKENEKI